MAIPETRPQMRDLLRLNLGQRVPYYATGDAKLIGEPDSAYEWPTNIECNMFLSLAISEINRECEFNVRTDLELPIEATSGYGVQWRSLDGVGPGVPVQAGINAIRSVEWVESGNTSGGARLFPASRAALDREAASWRQWSAGVPRRYVVEGYQIGLLPGTSTAGMLKIIAVTGLTDLDNDDLPIAAIPHDYRPIVADVATKLLLGTQGADNEAKEKLPYFLTAAEQGKMQIRQWRHQKLASEVQGGLIPYSFRRAVR